MTRPVDLSSLSVVFLSFDEPLAEANFRALLDIVPSAHRVHGVRGFDAAHRRAGAIAISDQVITVDGDNRIVIRDFFRRQYQFGAAERASVISFGARIAHNWLVYGNGGIKIWPRVLLRTLRTHEAARDGGVSVDFAGQVPYFQANDTPSETIVTATPKQAFRAGYREGARLTLAGRRFPHEVYPNLPAAEAIRTHIGPASRERLKIWCSIGRDVENGDWAMYGARLGCVHSNIDRLAIRRIVDYRWLDAYWDFELRGGDISNDELDACIAATSDMLSELELGIEDLDCEASLEAKRSYAPPRRLGALWVS